MNHFRSIGAVLAGWLTWGALCVTVNMGLMHFMPTLFRPDGTTESAPILGLLIAMSMVYSIVSGYLTATIAHAKPLEHAVALGVWNLSFGLYVQLHYWDVLPLWYHIPFLGLLIPGAMIGGWMKVIETKQH